MFGGRKVESLKMKDLQIDFMGKRKYALVLSALLVTALLSLGSRD